MRRRMMGRSLAWWGLVVVLALVVGAHIVFDILDIDGSDLPAQLFHRSLAAVTATVDVRRLAFAASLSWHALGRPAGFSVVDHAFSHVAPQRPAAPPVAFWSTSARRWQGHVGREIVHTSPPSAADPARPMLASV